jgi:hypothetical protein
MADALKTGELSIGPEMTFKIITKDDMARMALWSLRYGLSLGFDVDTRSIRKMILTLAHAKMLQQQDLLLLAQEVRLALVGGDIKEAAPMWEHFVFELERLA